MKEKFKKVKDFVEDYKMEISIGALSGFALGMTINCIRFYNVAKANVYINNHIINSQKTILKNYKDIIDTQAEFIKFLQK